MSLFVRIVVVYMILVPLYAITATCSHHLKENRDHVHIKK